MANWDYGNKDKNHDMSGEISLPNDSIVQVCDWTNGIPAFMKQADTLFIDPPWNIGNVKTFYTKAKKPHLEMDFLLFTEHLFNRISEIDPKFLFIEIGKEFLGQYLEKCKTKYKYVTFYNSTYYKKQNNKCYVIHATNEWKRKRYKALEDMDEENIIAWLCENHQADCIGDLCMGRGLVGKYAYYNSRKFVGTELNIKRLAVLVDYIREK